MDEVPVSYRENRKTWRKKKNRQPDLMSNPYFRKETKKVRDELDDSEEELFDEHDMDIKQAQHANRFNTFYDRKVAAGAEEGGGDGELHPWIEKTRNENGYDGVKHAQTQPPLFKAAATQDRGKKAFVCAYGNKCLNRCPLLRARIEC